MTVEELKRIRKTLKISQVPWELFSLFQIKLMEEECYFDVLSFKITVGRQTRKLWSPLPGSVLVPLNF